MKRTILAISQDFRLQPSNVQFAGQTSSLRNSRHTKTVISKHQLQSHLSLPLVWFVVVLLIQRSTRISLAFFKCGIRQFDIEYCRSCPDYALPLVLMRRYMFPLTPKNPGLAVHIKLMQTIHNMHYICSVSMHNIAK